MLQGPADNCTAVLELHGDYSSVVQYPALLWRSAVKVRLSKGHFDAPSTDSKSSLEKPLSDTQKHCVQRKRYPALARAIRGTFLHLSKRFRSRDSYAKLLEGAFCLQTAQEMHPGQSQSSPKPHLPQHKYQGLHHMKAYSAGSRWQDN